MGYELHITRAEEDWSVASDAPIDLAEWMEYARSDPRLTEVEQSAFADDRGEPPLYGLGYPHGPSITWWRGDIVVKGARETDYGALRDIAVALKARVQGDGGEYY